MESNFNNSNVTLASRSSSPTPQHDFKNGYFGSSLTFNQEIQGQKHEDQSEIRFDQDRRQTAATPSTSTSPSTPQLQDQTNHLPTRQVILIFLSLSLGLFTSFLDQTLVATALPDIAKHFREGSRDLAWIPTAYLVASCGLSSAIGRLSDVVGRKTMVLASLGVFTLGSVLATISKSMLQLIIYRAVTGLGSASVQSLVMIVISDVVSLRDRGKYQGILGVVNAVGNGIGPLLGGSLANSKPLGFRSVLLVPIPLNVVTAFLVIFLLPLKPVTGSAKAKLKLIDYLGILLVFTATCLCLLGLNWVGAATYTWSDLHVLLPLFISAILYVAFVLWEWKGAILPIIPLRIFKNLTVTTVIVQTFLSGSAMYVLLFFVPQSLQVLQGFTGIKAGIALIPLAVLQSLGSAFCGYLVSYFGRYKVIILIGLGLYALGIGLLTTVTRHTPLGIIIAYCVIGGLGAGASSQTSLVAAQCSVPKADMAVVTSVRNFARLFGGTIGLAVSYIILNSEVQKLKIEHYDTAQDVMRDPTALRYGLPKLDDPTRDLFQDAYTEGFENVFYFVLSGLLFGFSLTLIGMKEFPLPGKEAPKTTDVEMAVGHGKQEKRES